MENINIKIVIVIHPLLRLLELYKVKIASGKMIGNFYESVAKLLGLKR